MTQTYPIGTKGEKWNAKEKQAWYSRQAIKRSYQDEVLNKLDSLKHDFDLEQYGSLSYDPKKYPLFVLKSKGWSPEKTILLITGGVHGYETSGVQGALRFLQTKARSYQEHFNIVVVPCVSPWGYETINRWNPKTVDPNRSFIKNSPAEESRALMNYVGSLEAPIAVHIDLHETTDTDRSEFIPAKAARDGLPLEDGEIPDGFYLVDDTLKPSADFQKAMIESVRKVTHIAPADNEGKIIGVPITQEGVINYATAELGLCSGFTEAEFCTTTEVYPDSPKVDDENCILAQVAAIVGGLDYLVEISRTN